MLTLVGRTAAADFAGDGQNLAVDFGGLLRCRLACGEPSQVRRQGGTALQVRRLLVSHVVPKPG